MRYALALIIAASLTSLTNAQSPYPSGVWYGGPYAPSRVAPGYLYYNGSAPVYPIGANAFGGYYGGASAWEIRRLRWAVEDAAASERLYRYSRQR